MPAAIDPKVGSGSNVLGMDGLEFVEYATDNPEALGVALERLGFARIARHRSRRVFLYRQGAINVIVDADPEVLSTSIRRPGDVALSALAFRVADARKAYQYLIGRGAWPIPTRAEAMELNIPGVHGVGDSILYLVDRNDNISIYDVDFQFEPGVARHPPAAHGLQVQGVVQAIDTWRTDVWCDFYSQLFGFLPMPCGDDETGETVLASPCGKFFVRLLELPDDIAHDPHWDEAFTRLVFSADDLDATVAWLRGRQFEFDPRSTKTAALTRSAAGEAQFEFRAHSPAP